MKYEPISHHNNTEIAWLMMPFGVKHDDTNWELIDIVQATMSTLSQSDQDALSGIFYERKTYQELASDIGIKAKSHAWRKVNSATQNLKKALLKNQDFIDMMGEKYEL